MADIDISLSGVNAIASAGETSGTNFVLGLTGSAINSELSFVVKDWQYANQLYFDEDYTSRYDYAALSKVSSTSQIGSLILRDSFAILQGVQADSILSSAPPKWQYDEDYFAEDYTAKYVYLELVGSEIVGSLASPTSSQNNRSRISGVGGYAEVGSLTSSQTLERFPTGNVATGLVGILAASQFIDIAKYRTLIDNQFPEFYQEEFPQFITFVKKYYEFLDTQTNINAFSNIKDVDSTLDRFVANLKQDFAKNIPEFGRLDDRQFLLFAKEFYAARGSEDSYHFLFRAMFGKEIELYYPNQSVLRASDGRWQQEISIRIQSNNNLVLTSGDDFKLKSSAGQYVNFKCSNVTKLTDNLYDVFVDRFFEGKVSASDEFVYVHDGVQFSGAVVPVAGQISVLQGGTGFRAGQFFTVDDGSTRPIRVKVIKVDEQGSVTLAKVVQPGVSSDRRYAVLNPDLKSATQSSTSALAYPSATLAYIDISQITTLKYPGFYSTSNGFLSDDIKLHDAYYYQAFSYVVRLDEQISKYKSAVLQLVHPAGMELFGEYSISTDVSTQPQYNNTSENFDVKAVDAIEPIDTIDVGHDFFDEAIVRDTLDVGHDFFDGAVITDGNFKTLEQNWQDTIALTSECTVALGLEYFDTQQVESALQLDIQPHYLDVVISHSACAVGRDLLDEQATSSDITAVEIAKNVEDSQPTSSTCAVGRDISETQTLGDRDSGIETEFYSEESYFQDDYIIVTHPFQINVVKPVTDVQIVSSSLNKDLSSFAQDAIVVSSSVEIAATAALQSQQSSSDILTLLKIAPQTYSDADYFEEVYIDERTTITA